ncbi:hypothetical protein [uncultured Gemella sp.]|uniref:hypothetical protein n=1 Tax=uncultured Gemella sp. TaxID=254352 RepID=UPI0028D2F487|nr:hypothetical protein [uncultured Gemella sp.]
MVNWKKWFLEEDEDEVFEENTAKKEKKDELAERREKRAENRKRERTYYEDEEDFEIDFSSNKNRKSFDDELSPEFSENYEKTTKKLDDYEEVDLDDFEIDDYEDEDFEEEFKKDGKPKKENGFMSKLKGLFASNKKDDEFSDDELFEDEEDDEAEDYKTYLERQKREEKERARAKVVEENYEEEFDYEDEYEEETEKKVGFFARLKDKLFNVSDDEIDQEELDAVLDDLEELEEDKNLEEKKNKSASAKQHGYSEDELEIEFVEEQKATPKFEEIDITEYEEKEEVVSTGNVTDLGDALKKLGVSGTELRDVDIFDENPSRRAHPTLAAVRTKRLKQDHKIDALGDSVVLGKDSSELKEEVASSFKEQVQEDVVVQDERVTKNKDARKEFEENFNTLERRSDKIEKDNPLYAKKNDKLDGIFDEIREKENKTHEQETPELEVRELDAEGSRREKLKYTSVDDVLEGYEDLFEDDIDRVSKKLVGERFEEGQEVTEDVENFRKGLYEGKKSDESQEKTALDELIESANVDVSPKKEETLPEIEELNENLEDLLKEKEVEKEEVKSHVDLVQEAAKIEDIEIEDYEEIKEVKKDRLSGYSDYHLDEDEIEELEEKNYLDETTDSVDIDSLLREVSPNNKVIKASNDVDKFTDEKVVPKEVAQMRVEGNETPKKDFKEEEVERGIEYTEKLYTNDVSEYFDKGQGSKLGEYKTVDYGYRPVSKEKIENNQKILDAIFEKYSSAGLSTATRSVTGQMMNSNTITPKPRSVGKFKPSPVYSSVYGSAPRNVASDTNKQAGISTTKLSINTPEKKSETQIKKSEPKVEEKKGLSPKKDASIEKDNANIYKEIAAQEETVWNIGTAKRVPKNKVKNKKD